MSSLLFLHNLSRSKIMPIITTMPKANLPKPVEVFAIVNKENPKIHYLELYEKRSDVILDKDEEFIKVVIRKK